MRVTLRYDTRAVDLELPDGRFDVRLPPEAGAPPEPGVLLAGALDRPVGAPPLAEFLRGRRRLLLVVSDATRRTGSEVVLPILSNYFRENSLTSLEIKGIIATGIHRPPRPEEVRSLIPPASFPGAEILTHRAERREEMTCLGRTSFGNDVWLNRAVEWAEAILVVGSVGFHYFAGFSGGRKSLLPGLAWEGSIRFNHNLVFRPGDGSRHPAVATARLEGNPVHLDMMEAMERVGLDRLFLLNTLLDGDGRLAGLVAGHPVESHREACRRYEASHSATVPEPVDLVVASAGGAPRDINMIQAHKTVEMARYALRPGGTLVVLAACREGMGNPAFFPWFRFRSEAEFRRELLRNYVVNGQTALALFEKARRYRIFLVSELPPEDVRQMGLEPAASAAEAVARARESMPPEFRGLVLPDAPVTLCRPEVAP